MSRRSTTTTRTPAQDGACTASMVLMPAPAAGPVKADELDGELLALLTEAKRLCQEWQNAPRPKTPTMADFLAPSPWDSLIKQAAAIPARTPDGMRAKAEAVRWWVLGSMTACDHLHAPQEHLAISLVNDLLSRGHDA